MKLKPLKKKVKNALTELYDDYKNMLHPPQLELGSSSCQKEMSPFSGTSTLNEKDASNLLPKKKKALKLDYLKHRQASGCAEQKSELDKYLAEELELVDNEDFNFLSGGR